MPLGSRLECAEPCFYHDSARKRGVWIIYPNLWKMKHNFTPLQHVQQGGSSIRSQVLRKIGNILNCLVHGTRLLL